MYNLQGKKTPEKIFIKCKCSYIPQICKNFSTYAKFAVKWKTKKLHAYSLIVCLHGFNGFWVWLH